MKASYSTLMQSRFFSPAFNSAIFDGPIRIYFSQVHESLALKIYFSLQQKFPEILLRAKELNKQFGKNLLVMIYPTAEIFQASFENNKSFLAQDLLEDDTLLAINGPFEDERLLEVLAAIVHSLKQWELTHVSTELNQTAYIDRGPLL